MTKPKNRKPICCPKCGSHNIAEYLYGMPAWDDEELLMKEILGQIIIGGCCAENGAPMYHCNVCGKEWGKFHW